MPDGEQMEAPEFAGEAVDEALGAVGAVAGDGLAGAGWCVPCYRADGQLTLAAQPGGSWCVLHAGDAARGQLHDTTTIAGTGSVGAGAARPDDIGGRARSRQRPAQTALVGPCSGPQDVAVVAVADRRGGVGGDGDGPPGSARSHGPRSAAGSSGGASRGPGRTRRGVQQRARRRAAAQARGRRRAAQRVSDGSYAVHPGVENMLPAGRCRDQVAARRWVRELVDGAGWRSDRAAAAAAVLTRLVCAMDWETGLVTALTAAELAAAAHRSTRTVSRVVAWAIDHGLLLVAERPASAEFLGTEQGRTPTYAFYRPAALGPADGGGEDGPGAPDLAPDQPPDRGQDRQDRDDGPQDPRNGPEDRPAARRDVLPNDSLTSRSEGLGDLPRSTGGSNPSHAPGEPNNRAARGQLRLDRRKAPDPNLRPDGRWRLYVIPGHAGQREHALDLVLERIGIAPGSVSRRTRWALRGVLRRWWDADLAPAAVLHALGHHPDRPDQQRSTLTSGVRDLAAVIGARLRLWNGRLDEIPDRLAGHHPTSQTPAPDLGSGVEHGESGDQGAAAGAPPEVARPSAAAPCPAQPRPARPPVQPPSQPHSGSLGPSPMEQSSSAQWRAQLRAGFAAEQAHNRQLRANPGEPTGESSDGRGGRGTHPGPRRPRR